MRHILETLNAGGFVIDTLHVTGGHTKNPLLMELYADAVGCTVVEPLADEAVLTGTAALAATGAGLYPDLASACAAMRQPVRDAAAEPGGQGTLRPRLPHLPRNAPPAAGAGRDGVAGLDNTHRMMLDAGIAFDPDRLPKLVMTLEGVPDDARELTLLRQDKSHRGLSKFKRLKHLWAGRVNQEMIEEISGLPELEILRIKNMSATSLEPLARTGS